MAKTVEEKAQRKVEQLLETREAKVTQLEALVDAVADRDGAWAEEETATRARIEAEVDQIDARLQSKLDKRSRTEKAAEFRTAFGIGDTGPNNVGGGTDTRVTGEHRTYERGNGNSYFMDLFRMGCGDGWGVNKTTAMKRLRDHAKEVSVDAMAYQREGSNGSAMRQYFVRQTLEAINNREAENPTQNRDLSTAAGSGGEFVPPLYLTDQYVPYARPARVFADAQTKLPLPPGTMSLNIPKIYGGTTVAAQGTQNTNVSDTDLETEYITFPVNTVAGAQILSLQLLERSPVAFDDITFKDLTLACAQQVDAYVLTGTGAGNQPTGVYNTAGINTVTWTQASPTIKGFYGQIAYAKSLIAGARFLPATHIFVTPARWEWIEQQVDSNNRPLVVPEQNGPWNVMQVGPSDPVAEGVSGGRMLSCAVLQDFNIPANVNANQDLVFVLRPEDNYLYESPLVTRALPQTYGAQLSVLLQLYGYMAFTGARYPVSNSVITGTGLVTPVFNS